MPAVARGSRVEPLALPAFFCAQGGADFVLWGGVREGERVGRGGGSAQRMCARRRKSRAFLRTFGVFCARLRALGDSFGAFLHAGTWFLGQELCR